MKKQFIYGMMAAAGLLFAGCSDDIVTTVDNNIPTEGDRTLFVNVNIRGDVAGVASRATNNGNPSIDSDDFETGSEAENKVLNAYFVFYDANGNQVGGQPVPVDLSSVQWSDGENGTVEKYYQSVVGVSILNGQDNPAQVICYLNPQTPEDLVKPLSEIQTAKRSALTMQSTTGEGDDAVTSTYFSMSNSVYYPTTASQAPQIAVQIAPGQLFNTRTAAENALKAADASLIVNIYVERYAAKLSFNSVEPEDYTTVTRSVTMDEGGANVTLTFVPKTWVLNAACNETYVVKSFREESATGGDILADNYAYDELNAIINKNGADWKWNSTNYHRSYWGMSPAYFTAAYPEVSSDVTGELKNNLNQHYYSYDELLDAEGNVLAGYALPTTEKVTEYVHETTVGSKALASKNIVAALPSVILVGDYTVTVGNNAAMTNTSFYTYSVVAADNDKPLVYFEADAADANITGATSVVGGESILLGLIKGATNLYKQVTEDGKVSYTKFNLSDPADVQKLVAVLEVAEPSADVKGSLKVPERYRTLQFKSGATTQQLAGIYVGTADGYKTVLRKESETTPNATNITWVMANQELMNVVGFAAKYNAGAAYFNIPVKHYGWYRAANENNKEGATMDWSKVRVGDFGIVRNHSYDIAVTVINGLGTGIGGKNNPIVPPAEENRYYLAYSVNILQWALVPVQNVKL